MLLTGEYYSRLDAKNRLVIPSKVREQIDVQVEGSGWFLVPGFDGTISLYTPATFEKLAGREKAELFRLEDVRAYDRLHFALSAHAEMDRLGRVLVPETTLRRAGIGKDVVVIGVRDHLEVWDAAKWEAFVAAKLGQYDEMARKAYETELEDRRKSSS
mgnify:FL=1